MGINKADEKYKTDKADLSIQGFRTLLSIFSFSSLIITFINAIIGNTTPTGIPLTMFIYYSTKFIEYLEYILHKQCMFGGKSIIINTSGLVVSLLFIALNLIFGFINYTSTGLFVMFIIDLVVIICYLLLDMFAYLRQLVNHQKF